MKQQHDIGRINLLKTYLKGFDDVLNSSKCSSYKKDSKGSTIKAIKAASKERGGKRSASE
jgi:hypothetical protein